VSGLRQVAEKLHTGGVVSTTAIGSVAAIVLETLGWAAG